MNNQNNRKALIRGVNLEKYPRRENKFNRIFLFSFAPTVLEDPLGDFLCHEYKGDVLWEVRLEFFSPFRIRKSPNWNFKSSYRGFNHEEAEQRFHLLVEQEKRINSFLNLLGDRIRLTRDKPILGGLHRWKEYKVEKIDPDGFASLSLLDGGGDMLSKEAHVDDFLGFGEGYAEIAKLAFNGAAVMGGSTKKAQPKQGDVVLSE